MPQTSKRVTPNSLRTMKESGSKIVMMTAYDYPSAELIDAAGIDVILVGDSLGTVIQGKKTTLSPTPSWARTTRSAPAPKSSKRAAREPSKSRGGRNGPTSFAPSPTRGFPLWAIAD